MTACYILQVELCSMEKMTPYQITTASQESALEAVLCNKGFYQAEVRGPDAQRQGSCVILRVVSPADGTAV